VRRRDFDQFENYLRVVRYLRYGHKRDELYVLAGQLWGSSIGHGTLVNRYNNTLNLDRAKLGLALDVNTIWFGVETLADSIVDPALLASRAYVRPLGDVPYFHGWAVGATIAVDRAAPRSLATATSASGQTVLQVDEHGAPVVAVGEATYAAGIDTEFEVVHNSTLSLIPYVDLNRLLGAGNGLHTGILVDVRIPVPVLDIDLQARLEYRKLQAGYLPEYFDQQYDLARYQFAEALCGDRLTGSATNPGARTLRREFQSELLRSAMEIENCEDPLCRTPSKHALTHMLFSTRAASSAMQYTYAVAGPRESGSRLHRSRQLLGRLVGNRRRRGRGWQPRDFSRRGCSSPRRLPRSASPG